MGSPNVTAELRFHAASANPSRLDQTLFYRATPWEKVGAALGGRLSQSGLNLEDFVYGGEIGYALFSFLTPGLRLTQANRINVGAASTDLLARVQIHGQVLPFLHPFLSVGWFERFTRLSRGYIAPVPGNDVRDHDFALEIGARVDPADDWSVRLACATFEELEIFNLNNPFFEGRLGYHPTTAAWEASVFTRYQILLGFGRLDELMLGLSYALNL